MINSVVVGFHVICGNICGYTNRLFTAC